MEFIRSGGIEKCRAKQVEELEQRVRRLSENTGPAWNSPASMTGERHFMAEMGISTAAAVLRSLLD